jgi:peptide deformylase
MPVIPSPDRPAGRGQGIVTVRSAAAAVLRRPTERIDIVSRKIRKLAQLMDREMFLAGGVGLAAPQVARSLQVFVYDDRAGHRGSVVNPVLTLTDDEEIVEHEGCLSIPGEWHPVGRARAVYVEGVSAIGEPVSIEAEGFLARIMQHEYDHLHGVLVTDRSWS